MPKLVSTFEKLRRLHPLTRQKQLSAHLPKTSLTTKAGIGNSAGRLITEANVLVKSAFVT